MGHAAGGPAAREGAGGDTRISDGFGSSPQSDQAGRPKNAQLSRPHGDNLSRFGSVEGKGRPHSDSGLLRPGGEAGSGRERGVGVAAV